MKGDKMHNKTITRANLRYNDLFVIEKNLTDGSKTYSVLIMENDIDYGAEIEIEAISLSGAMKIFETIKENTLKRGISMIFWDVYLKGKLVDSVPYEKTCNKEYVLQSLINHDGYNPNIKVKRV
jgi:hypothetical protein